MNNKKTILYVYIIILILLILLIYYIHLMKKCKDKIEIEDFYEIKDKDSDIVSELQKINNSLRNINASFKTGINTRTVSYPM